MALKLPIIKLGSRPKTGFAPTSFARDVSRLEAKISAYEKAFKKNKDALNPALVKQLNEITALGNSMKKELARKATKYSVLFHTKTGQQLFERFSTALSNTETLVEQRKFRRSRKTQKKEGKARIEKRIQATNKELDAINKKRNAELAKLNWWQNLFSKQATTIRKNANLLRKNAYRREQADKATIKKEHFLGIRGLTPRGQFRAWRQRRFRA